jgi:hypothetical protein
MFHDDEMTGTEGCFSFLSVFIGWRWPLGVSECATLSGLGPWARLGGARGVTTQLFPVWGHALSNVPSKNPTTSTSLENKVGWWVCSFLWCGAVR